MGKYNRKYFEEFDYDDALRRLAPLDLGCVSFCVILWVRHRKGLNKSMLRSSLELTLRLRPSPFVDKAR